MNENSTKSVRKSIVENENNVNTIDKKLILIKDLTKSNDQSKKKISELKDWTIKNMIYSNLKVPQSWKNKNDYPKILDSLKKDTTFANFISRSDSISKESFKFRIRETFVSDKKLNYSSRNKTHNWINLKEKESILSDHKGFPLINKNSSFRAENSTIFNERNHNNLSKNSFRESETFSNTNPIFQLKNKEKSNKNDFEPIYLNSTKLKKIEIVNEKVKTLINECKGLGPYYSHCPMCNNKNLEYFKDLQSESAVKILNYIKTQVNQKNHESRRTTKKIFN